MKTIPIHPLTLDGRDPKQLRGDASLEIAIIHQNLRSVNGISYGPKFGTSLVVFRS